MKQTFSVAVSAAQPVVSVVVFQIFRSQLHRGALCGGLGVGNIPARGVTGNGGQLRATVEGVRTDKRYPAARLKGIMLFEGILE